MVAPGSHNGVMDLFSGTTPRGHEPLAFRMRPRTLEEYVGQGHIIGAGRLLRRVIQADRLSSLIFYGPPGTGKTTLARVIANSTESLFLTMNAVLSGVKQLRDALERAKELRELHRRRTTLFVDEVHRWNKAQQDALLPWVENGTVILIGATTENPYFEVNPSLVSRSRIFQLKPLPPEDLFRVARQALDDPERGYGNYEVILQGGALEHLVETANGDARSLLNALELAVETTPEVFPPPGGTKITITLEIAEDSIQRKALLYDKEGDYHFDTISAFIKSIRGSDPDAALYWMARMIRGGEEPRYLFRRMLISACEDVGLADPAALGIVESAAAAFDRVGLPEGQFPLTQAALYLATAPKSNSALGFFDALGAVEEEMTQEVPNHLRDASRDGRSFGHGEGYQYPHAYRDHWVAQQYLPRSLQGRIFYQPGALGYEKQIAEEVDRRRELQIEAALEESGDEVLTFSPPDKQKEGWLRRTAEAQAGNLKKLRDRIFRDLSFQRHHRVLVCSGGSGFLVWEALRRVPEGGVFFLPRDPAKGKAVADIGKQLKGEERPQILETLPEADGELRFEKILCRQDLGHRKDRREHLARLAALTLPGTELSLGEVVPRRSPRLSELLPPDFPRSHRKTLEETETRLFDDPARGRRGWTEELLAAEVEEAGFSILTRELIPQAGQARLTEGSIRRWLDPARGEYGAELEKAEACDLTEMGRLLEEALADREFPWNRWSLYIHARRG